MSWLLLLPGALATEWTVGSGGDYPTLGEALAVAVAGDTLSVLPGTYAERFTLAQPVTIQAAEGLGTVVLDGAGLDSPQVLLYTGTLRELTLRDAPGVAVSMLGSARLDRCVIERPGTAGVSIWGGAPVLSEVAVLQARVTAFQVLAGAPTIARSIAVDPGDIGFSLSSGGAYDNLVSFGGRVGFQVQVGATLSHIAAFDAAQAGVLAFAPATLLGALLVDDAVGLDCQGWGVVVRDSAFWGGTELADCDPAGLHDNLYQDPELRTWRIGARPPLVDLRPAPGSPLEDACAGFDPDATPADIGPMGGERALWTDSDGDGLPLLFDCDDRLATVHLHAVEQPNGWDDDCDGQIDEPADTGAPDTGDTGPGPEGRDLDGDGWTALDGDCEDHNRATWPGAPELVDGADNDCDGEIDEGTWVHDDDGDGFSEADGDCDDADPERSPGAAEQGEDGVDDDCDGAADGAGAQDRDGDGWTVAEGDCDDTDRTVHPEAVDGMDGVDSDCDGTTDDDYLAQDADHDGVTVGAMDCDDADISISPTSPERADDGIDQDCDGVDLYDVDGDGEPSPAAGGEDCDDTRAEAYPGAEELCNGLDDDCDGRLDENCDDAELDGPHGDTWRSAIHDGCNCHSGADGPRGTTLVALLGLLGLTARRRRDGRAR
ncbi:MAG: putative metal-binding motif-containing protein [Pseudomonadota bacterium]